MKITKKIAFGEMVARIATISYDASVALAKSISMVVKSALAKFAPIISAILDSTAKLFRAKFAVFTVFALFPLLISCKNIEKPRTELIFGTVCSVNAFSDGTKEVYDELFARLHKLDDLFSTSKSTSEIERINKNAGIESIEVSEEVVSVIKIALAFADLTDGLFEPTIGPIVKLWGINTENANVPTQEELDKTLELVDWKSVKIQGNSVFLEKKGMRLDLGGIVKGYAADVLVQILKQKKAKRAIINLGGNTYVYGTKKDKSPWRIGVKNPDNPEGAPELVLSLPESTVVTSGVYERFFIQDGIRYHHIINPKTGYPVNNGLTSVSVICKSSIASDALSTSLFLLGSEAGAKLISRIEEQNLAFEQSLKNKKNVTNVVDNSDKVNETGFDLILTNSNLPYFERVEGLSSIIEVVFITEDKKILASKDLNKFMTF